MQFLTFCSILFHANNTGSRTSQYKKLGYIEHAVNTGCCCCMAVGGESFGRCKSSAFLFFAGGCFSVKMAGVNGVGFWMCFNGVM